MEKSPENSTKDISSDEEDRLGEEMAQELVDALNTPD